MTECMYTAYMVLSVIGVGVATWLFSMTRTSFIKSIKSFEIPEFAQILSLGFATSCLIIMIQVNHIKIEKGLIACHKTNDTALACLGKLK